MRIATFNINGINTRLANLREWLEGARPDVVRVREPKVADARIPPRDAQAGGAGDHAPVRIELD